MGYLCGIINANVKLKTYLYEKNYYFFAFCSAYGAKREC